MMDVSGSLAANRVSQTMRAAARILFPEPDGRHGGGRGPFAALDVQFRPITLLVASP
ncbi:MAG: hypothetical protein HT579_13185 [Candidatus Accumulibacter similis]|nr:MAG: hypothetical protein HT579_13185 [Candidatus Accumulibacter similis]